MIATRESIETKARVARLERGNILAWLSLAFPLAVSAILNMWNLVQNGYSNTYYSVAVQSMTQSWKNFFFASYDAGGFITVDKPPVALWIQAISAKILGFSSLSILMPEALAGVASVALVYFLVKRIFGSLAAFVAALAMAVTPIAVAVERGNNTDTFLVFFLLLAAWAITRATEKGRLALLILGMALVGVAFNVKMLAAFIVLPTFYLLYMVAAPLKWHKRLLHLALASIVLLVVSFSWATAVQLTPAGQRPWIGGSQTNSVFDLALNYNGLGRVTGDEGNTMGGGQPPQGDFQPPAQGTFQAPGGTTGAPSFSGTNNGGAAGRNSGGMFGAGVAGPFRLFGSELASQWSWLFPLAAFGLVAAIAGLRKRLPLERKGQALLLWAGWLATYGVVFSMAEGIFHVYYLMMLAPAAAALVGIGVTFLWSAYRNGGWQAWLLPVALLAGAAWQVKVLSDYNYPQWSQWLVPVTVAGSIISAVPLLATRLFTRRVWQRVAPGLVGLGLLALLVSPLAWSVTPALEAGNGIMPQAGPSSQGQDMGGMRQAMQTGQNAQVADSAQSGPGAQGGPGGSFSSALVSYLEANNDGYFYLVAVSSANQASSISLETGKPVLAMGGFTGSDPAITVEKLRQLVATGKVRYILTGGNGMGGGGGASSAVTAWVTSNGTAVDASQYGGQSGMGGTLYDLAPR